MIILTDYIDQIKALPLKDHYEPEEVFTKDFLIAQEDSLQLYYCAHTEYINPSAKIVIVGITPGFSQLEHSLVIARHHIEQRTPLEAIPYFCKQECRLYGSMRNNTIDMLDELGLHDYLGLTSCSELFHQRDDLLHNTSIIPFAAFVDGKNYTGHKPKMMKSPLLTRYVEHHFTPELKRFPNSLIIPLGKSVEEVIKKQFGEHSNQLAHCLMGFPHPSGANGHRKKQFAEHKKQMQIKIQQFFSE